MMIYVLTHKYSVTDFLFGDLEEITPLLLPVEKENFLKKMLKKIQFFLSVCLKFDFFSLFFPSEIYKILQNVKKDDSLIFIGESSQMCYILSQLCPDVKKIAYFWNPCSTIKDCEYHISKMKSCGFKIGTFDYEDAMKYNLFFAGQLYKFVSNDYDENDIEYDFFFCGKNKGRKELVLKLEKQLSLLGKCRFIIPEKNAVMQYSEYLENVKKTRVLCDVNQNGQSGLTLRVMEALFFQKKLITNNNDVKKCDFYNPCNIFVFDFNTTKEDIQSFILKPYEKISDKIILKYEATTVFKELVNKA